MNGRIPSNCLGCDVDCLLPLQGRATSEVSPTDESGNSPYPCFIARARCWSRIGFGIGSRSSRWLRGKAVRWLWLDMDWCHISHIQSNLGHQCQPLSISHQRLETREGYIWFIVIRRSGGTRFCRPSWRVFTLRVLDVSVHQLKPLAAISFVWRCSAATSLEAKLSTLLRLPSCFHSPRWEAPRTVQ